MTQLTHGKWKEEFDRCMKDPVYFIKTYILINGKKPVLTDKDIQLIKDYNKSKEQTWKQKSKRT
jgi:hypothetical protein